MKKVLVLILILILAYLSFQRLSKPSISPDNPQIILYWGNGCPHCETVKDYIKDNQVDDKLKIIQKEVYYDKDNQTELTQKAATCGLDVSSGVGVPLAYFVETSQCFVGDTPIIDALVGLPGNGRVIK